MKRFTLVDSSSNSNLEERLSMSKPIACLLLTIIFIFASLLVSAATSAQKDNKAWMQWSKKDAEKMLTDSPWSQAQTETDTSEMFFSPTSDPTRMGTRRMTVAEPLRGQQTNRLT
jgi:hypothetical protein